LKRKAVRIYDEIVTRLLEWLDRQLPQRRKPAEIVS